MATTWYVHVSFPSLSVLSFYLHDDWVHKCLLSYTPQVAGSTIDETGVIGEEHCRCGIVTHVLLVSFAHVHSTPRRALNLA